MSLLTALANSTCSIAPQEISTDKPDQFSSQSLGLRNLPHDAIARLDNIVRGWVSNREQGEPCKYTTLCDEMRVGCRLVTATELRGLFESNQLLFRERVINFAAMKAVKLPGVPSAFSNPEENRKPGREPETEAVVLLKRSDGFLILSGGHSVFKALALNADNIPVVALQINDNDACQKLFGFMPETEGRKGRSFTKPGLVA